jgi:serine/threonine protein phosphatase PrpC
MKKIYSYSLLGKRETNEDNHFYLLNENNENNEYNSINFFGVFDGHGGKIVSSYLKKILPQYFINKPKLIQNQHLYNKSDTYLHKYFNFIYNKIQLNLIKLHPIIVQRCGSTALVGIQYKNKLWILNVGDSRVIKCNHSNIAEQLSLDHKPSSPTERIRIESLGGMIEYDGYDWRIKGLSLSRAFGDIDCSPYVTHTPDIYKYKIKKTDKYLVFACDGLFDVLSNQDIVDFINTLIIHKYNKNYAQALAQYAYDKGSLDNITIIIYFI